ncbi:hypothetical protein PGQ11_010732 [Apiospora arundinis]|uniref:DUF6546 domain-containing protein n=1 Tax=Apiospora arundinis TaxID=335852 RepID=A0ABR2IAG7_9PEZI
MASTQPISLTPGLLLWPQIPHEIKEKIWGYLGSKNLEENEVDDAISYPVLATVSKEWQEYFESITFKSLKVDEGRIEALDRIVSSSPRRVGVLRHLHLQIQLLPYDCLESGWRESLCEANANNIIFSNAVTALFKTMKSWPPAGEGEQTTLELSAFSPSDAQHCFKKLGCHKNNTLFQFRPKPKSDFQYYDLIHYWVPSSRLRQQCLYDIIPPNLARRVEGSGLHMHGCVVKFPEVPKFTAFTIRRQCYRKFGAARGLNMMLEALPNLTEFTYEPWMGATSDECHEQKGMEDVLMECVSSKEKIKTVRIFKSFAPLMSHCYDRETNTMPLMPFSLGPFYAEKSGHLDELSLSYITDAEDFFGGIPLTAVGKAFYAWMRWNNLKSLTLTAGELREDRRYGNILKLAAKGMKAMPKLEFMAIWNSGKGHGAVIRYVRTPLNEEPPKLSIQSTWNLRLNSEALTLWEEAAESHGSRYPLEVAYRDLDAERFKCYASLVHYRSDMSLVPGVATSTTMKEMEYDEKVMEWY